MLGITNSITESASGDGITYTNLTNADIKIDDKLWINNTATTTTIAAAQIEQASYNYIQTPNPNIIVGHNKVFTLTDNTYVSSANGPNLSQINALRTDKFGNLISEKV